MRVLWMVLLLLAAFLTACANDSVVVGEGGRVRLMEGERTDIRMVREWITIDLYHAFYQVTVDFIFRNDGAETRVLMGFPESGAGDVSADQYRDRSGFLDFTTWVDGQKVAAERRLNADTRETGYQAFWVKEVAFAPNQQHTVRVQYRAESGATSMGDRFVTYNFTGGAWKGLLDDSTLTLALHLPGTILAKPEVHGDTPPRDIHRDGMRFTAVWKAWQADGAFTLRYCTTDPGWARIAGISGGPFAEDAVTLRGTGQPLMVDWLPQALVRGGVSFIGFNALEEYLVEQARKEKQTARVTAHWDPTTRKATLQAGAYKLRYKIGVKELTVEVDGVMKKITLPAAPFMSQPVRGYQHGRLYVPLSPTIAALGGTAAFDGKTRELRLTVGDFWEAAR